jgi:hypothetical protein
VRYLFGAYDVHADRLHGRLRAHKNAAEVLAFYRQIRMRYDPRLRIYLVADNLSTHKTEAIRDWPPSPTSSASSRPPTRASSTASSATSGRSKSS